MVVVPNCAKIGHIKCKYPDVFYMQFFFCCLSCFFEHIGIRVPYKEIKEKNERKYKAWKLLLEKKWNDILSQTKPFPGEFFQVSMHKIYISISNGFQKHLRKQNVQKCIFLLQCSFFFIYEK